MMDIMFEACKAPSDLELANIESDIEDTVGRWMLYSEKTCSWLHHP
jgi:hypothetical protein